MNSQSLSALKPATVQQSTAHAKKLNGAESKGWILKFSAGSICKKVTHIMRVGDGDNGHEFALYERIDNNFHLIDFFLRLDSACDEAKEIIVNSEKFSSLFSSDNTAK